MATLEEIRRARAARAARYLARVEAGETYRQIGASEGISGKAVLYFIRREFGSLRAARPQWRENLVSAVDRQGANGETQLEIARALGVSFYAVAAIYRDRERAG